MVNISAIYANFKTRGPHGYNGHLSIRHSTLTSCQKGSKGHTTRDIRQHTFFSVIF